MMNLDMYLRDNAIFVIGCNYSDIIVRDNEDFLSFIYENGYVVSEILWWEYARIDQQGRTLSGGGGPRDPRNCGYFWSETDIHKTISSEEGVLEISEYIRKTKNEIPNHNLIPSFTVRKYEKCFYGGKSLEIIRKYLIESRLKETVVNAIMENFERHEDIASEFAYRICYSTTPPQCVTICVEDDVFSADSLMRDYKRIVTLHDAYSYLTFLKDDPDCAVKMLKKGLPIKD